jgi:NADH-quinone oxidoreductase subunit N
MSLGIVDLLLVSPALALFFFSLFPIGIKAFNNNKEMTFNSTLLWALTGVVAAIILTISTMGLERTAFNSALIFDGISSLSSLLVLVLTAFSLLISKENMNTATGQFSEFVFLLMNASLGMMLLSWSNDLIVTFIAIEIMSLCLYMIIALSREFRLSKEAALKYFILGSFGSAIFLYGVAFVFGTAGTTYLDELSKIAMDLISTNRLFVIGVVFVLIGFVFKVGLVPFHAWAPDVYEGSPTPVTGYMAAGVKVVIFAALLRFVDIQIFSGERSGELIHILQWIAVGSMLLGNIAAIKQESLKRMLAYSSISHSGYALVGVIAAGVGGESVLGASGTFYYILAYTIMTVGTFGFISLMEKNEDTLLSVSDLKGFAKRSPWMALCFSILLLSLAGIPPTAGFFGKFFIFTAAIEQNLFWLAIWGVISSIISVYYYLRPIVNMYMLEESSASAPVAWRPLTTMSLVVMSLLVLFVGLFSESFYRMVVLSVAKF